MRCTVSVRGALRRQVRAHVEALGKLEGVAHLALGVRGTVVYKAQQMQAEYLRGNEKGSKGRKGSRGNCTKT